jgi:signal transduction histidine kinase
VWQSVDEKNLQFVQLLVTIVVFLPILFITITYGTLINTVYLLIVVLVLSNSYIYGKRHLWLFSLVLLMILIILYLQNIGILTYTPELMFSDPFTTVISLVLLYVIYRISNIGFEQIEHSYNKAYEYAKELEEVNTNLDKLVQIRTEQLRESLNEQADSLHQLVVIGRIAKPVFHDIASPLTVIKGSIELMDDCKSAESSRYNKQVQMLRKAELQIERILNSSKDLLKSDNLVTTFNPLTVINTVLEVLSNDLCRNSIKVIVDLKKDIKITGSINAFERIFINLTVNAIQALNQSKNKREIKITDTFESNKYTICFEDNGCGMTDIQKQVAFNSGFTSKDSSSHLGIGLYFVQTILESKFHAEISIESEVGEYTKFVMKFNDYEGSH